MQTQEIAKELVIKAIEHQGVSLLNLKPGQAEDIGRKVGEMYLAVVEQVERGKRPDKLAASTGGVNPAR